ncbi:DUF1272 domain-containing protein [uncultured Croceitalea sp.]|uniref:DUF1272 domain-containing protein n=1 Tax=uncultured Croceitalea sp. TaxID=1798908 RepID=UPI003306853A
MLELRPTCENCDKPLPPDSQEAMICTYECTFCISCVEEILENVCPNCGGGFEKRPVRPKGQLTKNPPTGKHVFKPVNMQAFPELRAKYQNIPPNQR